jgi:hypothetical protein
MTHQIDTIETPDQAKLLPPIDFTIALTECVESVGVGLVSTERAQRLVPPPFKLLNNGAPVTPLVVLAMQGRGIAVADAAPSAGIIVQIGLIIAPPDGTGEINTFSLWHFTTHSLLARSLRKVGLNTQYVPTIHYNVTLGGKAGSTHITVPAPAQPELTLGGAISEASQPIAFNGSWWAKVDDSLLKLNSIVPSGLVREAQLTLATPADSPLGNLIGDATLSFAVLQRFNTFMHAQTQVSVRAG